MKERKRENLVPVYVCCIWPRIEKEKERSQPVSVGAINPPAD